VANPSIAVKSNNYQIIVEWKSIRANGNNSYCKNILKIHHNPVSFWVCQL